MIDARNLVARLRQYLSTVEPALCRRTESPKYVGLMASAAAALEIQGRELDELRKRVDDLEIDAEIMGRRCKQFAVERDRAQEAYAELADRFGRGSRVLPGAILSAEDPFVAFEFRAKQARNRQERADDLRKLLAVVNKEAADLCADGASVDFLWSRSIPIGEPARDILSARITAEL